MTLKKKYAPAEGQESSRGESAVLQAFVQKSHTQTCTIKPQLQMRLMILFSFFFFFFKPKMTLRRFRL